jgi:hypothetical protein
MDCSTRSLILTLLLCACGPKGGDTDDTTDGTSADSSTGEPAPTTADAPSSTTGEPSATSTGDTSSSTTASSSTTDVLCEDPTVTVGPSVELKIRNATDAPVFVDHELGCKRVQPYDIVGPDGAELKLDLGFFEFPCSVASGSSCGEDPGCPFDGQVIQIAPGASITARWSGGGQIEAPLSEACAEQFCGGCWIEEQAPDGVYTVRVPTSTAIECDGEPSCPGCDTGAEGFCITQGVRMGNKVIQGDLNYPSEGSLELVIP